MICWLMFRIVFCSEWQPSSLVQILLASNEPLSLSFLYSSLRSPINPWSSYKGNLQNCILMWISILQNLKLLLSSVRLMLGVFCFGNWRQQPKKIISFTVIRFFYWIIFTFHFPSALFDCTTTFIFLFFIFLF